jgi:copper homeostasis protein
MRFEVCVESAESCAFAEEAGADRVELCSALLEGGLTPSVGLVRLARRLAPKIGIMAMVRPRGGDFCYSDTEFEVMAEDIRAVLEAGADGAVLGLLKPDGTVDEERTRRLVELAAPKPVTFHRAFDMAVDPFGALEAIIRTGCTRVLSSGQEATALEGASLLAEIVRRAGDRLTVMVGGGVREHNISQLVETTGADEYHFTAFETLESRMAFRNPRISMGSAARPPEYSLKQTSPALVRACIAQATGKAGLRT